MTEEQRLILRSYVEARLVKRESTGCWEWALSRGSHGYGQGSLPSVMEQRVSLAHRMAFIAWNGEIQDGQQIDHLCRNKICCNPDHLEAVSQHINIRRQFGLHENLEVCAHGHSNRMARDNRGLLFCRECQLDRQRRRRSKKVALWHRQ